MTQETERLVVEGDEDGILKWREAVVARAGDRVQTKRLRAQAGDPNTWMLVAEVAKVTVPALISSIVALLGQKKIRKIKLGDVEAEDISAAEFERLLANHHRPAK